MKKILFILIIIISASLMVGSVSADGLFDMFATSSDNANNETVFIVGFNSEFPPFTYMDDNGSFTGFDLELAQEVADRNNWTFTPQPIIDRNSKDVELNSNEVDCIWSEFTINGRVSDYEWTDSYFNNSVVIAVKNDSEIKNLDDLKGKSVEVQEGTSAMKYLNNHNQSFIGTFSKLTEIKEYNTGFMDLESGACDALIVDVGLANYKVDPNNSGNNFRILDEPLCHEQYGVAFKKGNADLKNQVQKTLDEMFKDGTVDKIAQKYSEYHIPDGVIHH